MTTGPTEKLESSREQLLKALQGFTEVNCNTRPDADSWCAAEVLTHLLNSEHRLRERVRQALGQRTTVTPVPLEPERRAEAEAGRQASMDQLVHSLLVSRRETLDLVAAMQPEDLSRPASHPDLGTITVGRMLERIAEHEQLHADQLSGIASALN